MAIASPFCTKAEVRLIAPELTAANLSDENLDLIIAEADKDLIMEVGGCMDLVAVYALTAIPSELNRMSTMLSRAYAYKYYYGDKRITESDEDLYHYWLVKYNELIRMLCEGQIVFHDSTGAVVSPFTYSVSKTKSKKFFGTDNFDQYDSDDD